MATLSRSAFFSVLVSTGAFALVGCGGSTEKNSTYTGSYRSAYSITTLGETGTFNFTVDTKGKVSGLMDNLSGEVREVNGSINADGAFEATTRNRTSGATGVLNSTVSSEFVNNLPGSFNNPTPVSGGNFSIQESGVTSVGNFLINATPTQINPGNDFRGYYGSNIQAHGRAISFGGAPEAALIDSNSVDFNVDTRGVILGTLGSYPFEAVVNTDSRIVGTVTDASGTKKYPFRGIINKVRYLYDAPKTIIGSDGKVTETTEPATANGIGATLIFNIEGKEYYGTLRAVGGSGANQ